MILNHHAQTRTGLPIITKYPGIYIDVENLIKQEIVQTSLTVKRHV